MSLFDRLDDVEQHYRDLSMRLGDPEVAGDHVVYTKLAKEHAHLEALVECYRTYRELEGRLEEAREMVRDPDPDIQELARQEIPDLERSLVDTEEALKVLLLPRDPLDDKNILLEVRAGTGGDEAALFAGDLFDMYSRFARNRGWRVEEMSVAPGTQGGYKEIIALISGDAVYSQLKYESGTHRVQRVPATESQGRIHTSACTIAILPEADDVDVEIKDTEIEIDTYRASGAGGQHVNTTDSAVRITHLPTGLVVTSQDERSQHKNKARALKVLRSRILEHEINRQQQARASERRGQVGSGDRSERIRTYNFPQNRITDHRIGLTIHALDRMMGSGEIDEILDALRAQEQAQRLADEGLA